MFKIPSKLTLRWLFLLAGIALMGCGGGGSTAPTTSVAQNTASFTLGGDITRLSGAPGATSTMNVTVAPQGTGDTNFQVNLAFNGSDGVTGAFSPTSVPGSGGTSSFTMSVDPELFRRSSLPL